MAKRYAEDPNLMVSNCDLLPKAPATKSTEHTGHIRLMIFIAIHFKGTTCVSFEFYPSGVTLKEHPSLKTSNDGTDPMLTRVQSQASPDLDPGKDQRSKVRNSSTDGTERRLSS